MKTTLRGATIGMTRLSANETWLLATMTGPVGGTLSLPSTVGRQTALASGGTTACVTSYNIGTLPRAPSVPGVAEAVSGGEGQLRLRRTQRRVDAVEEAAHGLAGVHPGD